MSLAKNLKIGQYIIMSTDKGITAHRIKRLHEICSVLGKPHVHIVAEGLPEKCQGFNIYVPSASAWHVVESIQAEELQKQALSRAAKKRRRAEKARCNCGGHATGFHLPACPRA